MRQLEIVVGVIMIGVFAVVIWSTRDLVYWQGQTPGPSFAPFWVSVLGIFLCVLMIFKAVTMQNQKGIAWPSRPSVLRLILIALCLWAVIPLAPILGFVLSAGLFCFVFTIGIMRKPWIPSLLTTFVVLAILQFVFVMSLDVKLPTGTMGF